MKRNPKISIVTPSYNLGKYIRRAIDSVLTQKYENFEYFVIDGGSTDETLEILKEYDDDGRMKWISEPDKGQTDAINKGLNLSTGDLFAWLNADDYYEDGALEKVAEVFKRNPEVGVIYGNCFDVSPTYKKLNKPPKTIDLEYVLNHGNIIYGPASFFNLKLVKQVDGFDTRINYWMDYDMYLRLRKISEFYYLDEDLANFMIRAEQKSRSDDKNQYKKFLKEAYTVSVTNGGIRYNPLYFATYPKVIRVLHSILWRFLHE